MPFVIWNYEEEFMVDQLIFTAYQLIWDYFMLRGWGILYIVCLYFLQFKSFCFVFCSNILF